MTTTYLALVLTASLWGQSHTPPPAALVHAHTVFLVNNGVTDHLFDSVNKALTQWGRFQLVDSREASDVTFTISPMPRGWSLAITESATGALVWRGNIGSSGNMISAMRSGAGKNFVTALRKLLNEEK